MTWNGSYKRAYKWVRKLLQTVKLVHSVSLQSPLQNLPQTWVIELFLCSVAPAVPFPCRSSLSHCRCLDQCPLLQVSLQKAVRRAGAVNGQKLQHGCIRNCNVALKFHMTVESENGNSWWDRFLNSILYLSSCFFYTSISKKRCFKFPFWGSSLHIIKNYYNYFWKKTRKRKKYGEGMGVNE